MRRQIHDFDCQTEMRLLVLNRSKKNSESLPRFPLNNRIIFAELKTNLPAKYKLLQFFLIFFCWFVYYI